MSTRSKSLFDLCPRSLRFILSNIFYCNAARPIEAKSHVELLWVVRMKVCSNCLGHVTKMAAMPVYGKNLLKIFSETSRLMIFELGVQHQGFGPYKVCANDDHVMTLTYFIAKSTLPPNAFEWEMLTRFYRNY